MKKYKTNKKFKKFFPKNLVICCSDGRFVDATLNFVVEKLNIKEKDLLILPGSIAFCSSLNEKNLIDRTNLLIEKHSIKKIIIFSHIDCGFYKSKFLNKQEQEIINKQIEDLKKAKNYFLKRYPYITIESYFAGLEKNKIVFDKI